MIPNKDFITKNESNFFKTKPFPYKNLYATVAAQYNLSGQGFKYTQITAKYNPEKPQSILGENININNVNNFDVPVMIYSFK